jgi:hypothetical protein
MPDVAVVIIFASLASDFAEIGRFAAISAVICGLSDLEAAVDSTPRANYQ